MSLARRTALLTAAVAVITGLLAGALSIGLVRRSSSDAAHQTLSKLADAAQAGSDVGPNAEAAQLRARRTLQALKIQSGTLSTTGTLATGSTFVRSALTAADIEALQSGRSVSEQHRDAGQTVLVEGRPTRAGAIVLAQRLKDATATADKIISRIVLALVIGVVIAVILGVLAALQISRPLRRTAAAAHSLAEGRRDVQVPVEGPVEVAELGVALNTLAEALGRSEARQREFLLSVSHDLRTPLTAITGYAESLADGVVPASQARGVGDVMLGEAHRLNRLVSDLLDLARLGADDFRIDLTTVDLTQLAADAARVWYDRCRAEGVEFALQAPPFAVPCRTDPTRVRQILDGLLENALRVTPAGAPIVLALRPEGPTVAALEVRDGGPGLSDDDLAVAFDRGALYSRYRGVRRVGTGLGLAIVHALARRLGADVEAGHASEGGARFTVRMPVG